MATFAATNATFYNKDNNNNNNKDNYNNTTATVVFPIAFEDDTATAAAKHTW